MIQSLIIAVYYIIASQLLLQYIYNYIDIEYCRRETEHLITHAQLNYSCYNSYSYIAIALINYVLFCLITSFSSVVGVTYIRWGRISCPDTEKTEVLYKGKAAGKRHDQIGGGSNYLCLTDDPVSLPFTAGQQSTSHRNFIYGAEYETTDSPPALGSNHNFNVPCVACYSSVRSTKIMIPGTMNCSSSWTREYYMAT